MVDRPVEPRARHLRFVYLAVFQLLLSVVLLAALGVLTIELFITVSLLVLLLTAQFTSPLVISPKWRDRLKWVLVSWFLLFGYIIIQRINRILEI